MSGAPNTPAREGISPANTPRMSPLRKRILTEKDFIISQQKVGLSLYVIADQLGLAPGSIYQACHAMGLTRAQLGLGRVPSGPRAGTTVKANRAVSAMQRAASGARVLSGGAAKVLDWSAAQDRHIRRGHFCGFTATAVGGQCGRSGLIVRQRARDLGLGQWDVVTCPRLRKALAATFDADHAARALSEAEGAGEDE